MPRFKNVDGVIMHLTTEQEKERDKQEKAVADEMPSREMAEIREHRDILLRKTDWMALEGHTMSDKYTTYRQKLRDIPASNTVYANVTWPTKP